MPELWIIVPSYQRPFGLQRLWASVQAYAPHAQMVAVVQGDAPPLQGAHIITAEPEYPAKLRRLGAAIAPSNAILLFVDDDHALLPPFSKHYFELAMLAQQGLVSLPVRRETGLRVLRMTTIAGGMLIYAPLYWDAGGHGEDYLDDIELSLRVRWAGYPIYRYPHRVSVHHVGMAGGLKARPEVHPKRTAHLRLSRLDEQYPDRIQRANTWWGFRERG